MSEGTAKALGYLGKAFGIAATAFAGVGVVIAVAQVFDLLQGGDDNVTKLFKTEAEIIKRRIASLDKKGTSRKLRDGGRTSKEI